MADTKTLAENNTFQFATIENLELFKDLLDGEYLKQLDKAVAPALKTVSQSADGATIFFYTKEAPVSEDEAAFAITLPIATADALNNKADKVADAVEGNLAGLDEAGNLTDSGYSPSDFDIAGASLEVQTELLKLIGSIPMDAVATTIVGYIQEAVANGEYDDTELREAVSSNTVAIDILNGVGAGSVKQAVLDGLNEFVEGAPESLDTYKELCDWILNHESDAAAMNSAIHENAQDIEDLKNLVGTLPSSAESTTIVDYVSEVVADAIVSGGSSIYALKSDLDAAVERIDDLEETSSELITAVNINTDKLSDLTGYVGTIPASSAATSIVEYIEESINAWAETTTELLKRIDTAESNISAMQEDLTQAQTDIAANTEAIEVLQDTVGATLEPIPEEDIIALFEDN